MFSILVVFFDFMKKILFISNFFPSTKSPNFGTFVKTSAVQLEELGFVLDYSVVTNNKRGLKKLFDYICFFFKTIRKIIFNDYHFSYVHYLTYSTVPIFISLLFGSNLKFFINIHGDDLVGTKFIHKIMGLSSGYLLQKSTGIIVPSEYFRKILLVKFPKLNKNKILVSPSGGVNSKLFFPYNSKVLSVSDKKRVFGFVSRIDEGKGWEDLLASIDMLPVNLNAQFLIYGSGSQEYLLKQKLKIMKNGSYVEFLGSVVHDEVPKIFNSINFFIFPTHRESLGLVLLESMSCGIPVILTRIDPLIDIVGKDYSLYIDLSSPQSLHDQILRCLRMKNDEYVNISNKNLEVSRQYDAVNVSRVLYDFIMKVLK